MSATKIEFAVQMKCDSCANAVEKSLANVDGIKHVNVDLKANTVVVQTTLSADDVRKRIQSTGRKVVIKGLDGSVAAVSILDTGNHNVKGVVRFTQLDPEICIIDGTIDGLKPAVTHKLSIHECGDLSNGCENVGDYFNPCNGNRTYGDLGDIKVDENGRCAFRLEDDVVKLSAIIGRSLVVSEMCDNKCNRLSCGIIARSSGLFQNPKTICACDGTTLWDETKKPIASL